MTCRTCKYWDNERPFDEIAFRDHKPGMELGECLMASPASVPEQRFLAVATCNSESIYGELITQAQFGCIQYEQKQSNP